MEPIGERLQVRLQGRDLAHQLVDGGIPFYNPSKGKPPA
jgi:hypothetical protein